MFAMNLVLITKPFVTVHSAIKSFVIVGILSHLSMASKIVTSQIPPCTSSWAAESPAIPAPMITTFGRLQESGSLMAFS